MLGVTLRLGQIMRLLVSMTLVLVAMAAAGTARAAAVDPYAPSPYVKLQHPVWSQNAVLYQINTRQFTADGTFDAARAQLHRLKALGVALIWRSEERRVGKAGDSTCRYRWSPVH